jgi:capsular polysaccharide export protein
MHEEACRQAAASGLNIHVFEEGYLRPYWVSYERNGANGRSALMSLDIKDMRRAVEAPDLGPPVPPGHWGDTRQHVFYGALYHWFVMFLNHRYPAFQSHRKTGLGAEFYFHFKRLVLLPIHAVERFWVSRLVKARGAPFHLALLQLEHDASFQVYGPFERQEAFIDTVITAFAQGAPVHHHLVFKAHPLEDGRAGLPGMIRRAARRMGLANRVHFIRGGKLAWLLNDAEAVVTVNSTAGQQALWRGLPLRALGRAVYCKPELVSEQPLADFFAAPKPPDRTAYAVFREYLLRTSQIPGGFYARRGRDQIVRRVVDQMLEPPASEAASAAQRQHLRLVP